jgi:hypothetical protein
MNVPCLFKVIDGVAVCSECNRKVRRWTGRAEDIVANCRTENPTPAQLAALAPGSKRYRPRTEAELEAVIEACNECDHLTTAAHAYGSGLCGLKLRDGCGSCKNRAEFASFRRSGMECPADPPRFPATYMEAAP